MLYYWTYKILFFRCEKGVFLGVFSFLDEVTEVKKNESLTAFFTLKGSEEFLKDHFAGFPVMPGVLQLESLRQAASRLLSGQDGPADACRFETIGSVKYGQFIRPGRLIKIFVRLTHREKQRARFEGRIDLMEGGNPAGRAVLADFTVAAAGDRSFGES